MPVASSTDPMASATLRELYDLSDGTLSDEQLVPLNWPIVVRFEVKTDTQRFPFGGGGIPQKDLEAKVSSELDKIFAEKKVVLVGEDGTPLPQAQQPKDEDEWKFAPEISRFDTYWNQDKIAAPENHPDAPWVEGYVLFTVKILVKGKPIEIVPGEPTKTGIPAFLAFLGGITVGQMKRVFVAVLLGLALYGAGVLINVSIRPVASAVAEIAKAVEETAKAGGEELKKALSWFVPALGAVFLVYLAYSFYGKAKGGRRTPLPEGPILTHRVLL